MQTVREYHKPRDDISLLELVSTLWSNRVTIFLGLIASAFVGIAVIFLMPSRYVGEYNLHIPVGADLAKFAPLNDKVLEHYVVKRDEVVARSQESEAFSFLIEPKGLVQSLLQELQNKTTYLLALRDEVPSVANMSDADMRDARREFLSKFTVNQATDRDPVARVSLEWPDEDQLYAILMATIGYAEQKVAEDKLHAFGSLVDNIKRRDAERMQNLKSALGSIERVIDLETRSRVQLLKEQAAIARAMNLPDNSLGEGERKNRILLNTAPREKNNSLEPKSEPETLYLRGYKALEKEIALLETRTSEQRYHFDSRYIALQRDIIGLEDSREAAWFRQVLEESPFAEGDRLFQPTKNNIAVTNKKNPLVILVAALMFGLFVSSALVLGRHALSKEQRNELI